MRQRQTERQHVFAKVYVCMDVLGFVFGCVSFQSVPLGTADVILGTAARLRRSQAIKKCIFIFFQVHCASGNTA